MSNDEPQQANTTPLDSGASERTLVLEELEIRGLRAAQQIAHRRMLFLAALALILVGAFFWLQTEFVAQLSIGEYYV